MGEERQEENVDEVVADRMPEQDAAVIYDYENIDDAPPDNDEREDDE